MDPTLPPPAAALPDNPIRDRRFIWAAGGSTLLHGLVLVWILLPPSHELATPPAPEPVSVEIVTPEQLSSMNFSLSLEPSSSVEVSSSEASSSFQPASSAEPSSASAAASSEEPPSSAAASSVGPPSSAEASSAAPPSSAEASSAPDASSAQSASSAETASSTAAAASSAAAPSASASEAASAEHSSAAASSAPQPMPGRPITIPIGPSDAASASSASGEDESSAPASGDASSEADAASSVLTAEGAGPDGVGSAASSAEASGSSEQPNADPAGGSPVVGGKQRTASTFYASAIFKSDAPETENMREALKKLPKQRRVNQLCLIEAIGQVGHASARYHPDAIIGDALAPTVAADLSVDAPGAAFRSDDEWYGLTFQCRVSKDLLGVASFTFRIGDKLAGPPVRAQGPAKKASSG